MRLKEAKVCSAFTWNPAASEGGNLLASASVAGAMDDDFSSDAFLEVRRVDLTDTDSTDLPIIGRTAMNDRAHRVDWSPFGGGRGILAAGLTDGTVQVWSADKIVDGFNGGHDATDATLCTINAHSGGVRGCRFNVVQPHFLATGGQDGKLCIWSLENPTDPVAVPALNQPDHQGEITDVRWNVKYERIIGVTTSSGLFAMSDLRSGRRTQQIVGQQGGANTFAWHPEGLTQIAIARDFTNPVIQIWDLKKAVAPIKELRLHTGGISGLSWCPDDPSLLMSSGTDGRTICWNPFTGEMVGEMPAEENWVYDVQWCPRVPAVIGTSSFDSVLGVSSAQSLTQGSAGSCPKWFNRPCTASFGFGGKIVQRDPVNPTTLVFSTYLSTGESDSDFRTELEANGKNLEWVADRGMEGKAIAAAARAAQNSSRQAIIEYVGLNQVEDGAADAEEVFGGEGNLNDAEFDEKVSEHVAAGRLGDAVNLCVTYDRFDDAFAIAYLQGTDKIKEVHNLFVAKRSESSRFAKLVSAVTTGKYDALNAAVVKGQVPWKEGFGLLATYLNATDFAAAAGAMGKALETTDKEGAISCYICSGNVNAAADMWASSGLSDVELLHMVLVMESATNTQCTALSYSAALARYGDYLAKIGDYDGSLLYANRSASIGSEDGAVVADRSRRYASNPGSSPAPLFRPQDIPVSNSPEIQRIAAMQQPVQRVQPAPQPATQASRHVDPRTHVQQGGQNQYAPQPTHNVHQAPVHSQPSVHNNQPPVQPTNNTYQPPVHSPLPVNNAHPPVNNQPPVHNHQPVHNPSVNNTYQPPVHNHQPPVHNHPPVPPVHNHPPVPPVHNTAPPVNNAYLPPVHNQPPPVPQPPPVQQSPVAGGVPSYPSNGNLTASRGSSVTTASPTSALASFDVDQLHNPSAQTLMLDILAAISRVTDKRKRDAIEKSTNELFNRLKTNSVSQPVLDGLGDFVANIGTPKSKEAWRRLSDGHMSEVQSFINLKFL